MKKLFPLAICIVCILMLIASEESGSAAAGEIPAIPNVGQFIAPDGRVDLEAARAGGYQGPLDLSGFDVRLDPLSGQPVIRESHPTAAAADPDDQYWEQGPSVQGIDGNVYALAVYGGLLIAGGDFDVACDILASNIAAWNGSSWSALGSGMDGRVLALTVYDGRLIAGGEFRNAGVIAADRVAAWDGASWASLGSGLNSSVYALSTYDNKLIAGGAFTTAGGVSANGIAAWDGAAWAPLGSGMNSSVSALAAYDNKLIAGGSFTTAGGVSVNMIAAWDGAVWAPLGSGMNSSVSALATYDNKLIAGGSFTAAGGISANMIAAWDGAVWAPIGSGMNGKVLALTICDGMLVAGGEFSTAGGASARYIAAWNGAAWAPLGSGLDGTVRALAAYDNELVAGGDFTAVGDAMAGHIAAWDGSAWLSLGSGSDGRIYAFTIYDGRLIAGGNFTRIDGIEANRIAAWDGTTWTPLGSGMNGSVNALTTFNNKLIAGGSFTTAGGVAASYIASWDGSSWSSLLRLSGSPPAQAVNALTVYNGKLIAGNSYAIQTWNGYIWDIIGFLEPYNNMTNLNALTIFNDRLIAGGTFSIYGTDARNVAAWNGTSWASTGAPCWYVLAMVVYDSKLIVGGAFGLLMSWDGSGTWLDILWESVNYFDQTCCLAVYNDKLIAGGYTFEAPGRNINAWDGSTWSVLGSGLNNGALAAAVNNDKLMVGGALTVAGNKVSASFAQWNKPAPTAVLITGFDVRPTESGIELAWSLSADERIVGYRIYRSRGDDPTEHVLNEQLIDADARTYIDETALPGERYRYVLGAQLADGGEVRSFSMEAERAPLAAQLYQNVPNPFNPATSIRFTVPHASHVTMRIYSLAGEVVRALLNKSMAAGTWDVTWDGTNDRGISVTSGVYFYRLCVDRSTLSKKMLLMR